MDTDHSANSGASAPNDEGSGGGGEELLSIGEAALRYGVPATKINRLAYLNQLDGARKVRGVHGLEWRVPAAELEARGFQRQDASSDAAPRELAELQRSVRLLTDRLVQERQRWADKQRELETALLEIGALRGQLKREQLQLQQAERDLADLTQRLTDLAQAADPANITLDLRTVDLRTAQEQQARPG